MGDVREGILARLLEIASGIDGIKDAARNRLDVAQLARPAIVIKDGSEQLLDRPQSERRARVQRIEMSPAITLYVGGPPADQGSLLNAYRARFLGAAITDGALRDLISGDVGEIRYEGCSFEEPGPEQREARMEINLVLVYTFKVSDLQ